MLKSTREDIYQISNDFDWGLLSASIMQWQQSLVCWLSQRMCDATSRLVSDQFGSRDHNGKDMQFDFVSTCGVDDGTFVRIFVVYGGFWTCIDQ